MKRTLRALSFALASTLAAASASAQPATTDLDQAKTYFNAGAQAYAAGQFPAAVQAFEQAYKLAPKPAILFSIAQAHRRQYYLDKRPERLTEAIRNYRQYVTLVPQGGRRADAAQALAELEPLAARLAPVEGEGASEVAAAPAAEVKAQTRIMVSSPTPNAEVALDGKPAGVMPLIEEVEPGRHTVEVKGEGYFGEQREVIAVEGGLIALDVPLREMPARLSLTSLEGAQVAVDGRPMGTTPLQAPLELAAGKHLLVVTKPGSRTYTSEIEVGRGESRALDAPLAATSQRVASYVLMLTGAGGMVVGGVFSGLAFRQQTQAESVLTAQQDGNITAADRDAYNVARTSRDDWRRAAGVAFGAGAAVGVTGLLLYVLDAPVVDLTSVRSDESPRGGDAAPKKSVDEPLEMSAVPVWTGDGFGASLAGRF